MAINTNYSYNNFYGLNASNANSLFGGSGSASAANSYSSLFSNSSSASAGFLSGSGINYDVAKYVAGLKDGSANLKSSLSELTSKNPAKSVYGKQAPASSSAENVTVSVTSGWKGNTKDATVSVSQVATGQMNQGENLAASARNGGMGYRQIEISVGGKTHQVSFQVSSSDTNQAMQQKMADAINKRGIGVTASVSAKDGKSALTVQSSETGDQSGFSIRDISGDAVAKTGVGAADTEAKNAIYRVNGGEEQTSRSNTVDIGGGVTATFIKASDKEVTISSAVDTKSATDMVQKLVNNFNNLLSTVNNTSGASSAVGGSKLLRELTGISKSYSSSLSNIGINVSSSGSLSVNADKVAKAAQDGSLEKFFTGNGGASYGFSSRLSNTASSINRSPARYLGGVYPNNHYLNNSNQGLLLNMLI